MTFAIWKTLQDGDKEFVAVFDEAEDALAARDLLRVIRDRFEYEHPLQQPVFGFIVVENV